MFEKGQQKLGGRKKGSKNRKPPMKSLRQSLADLGFDLGKELTDLLNGPLDSTSRLKALELIARYTQVAPKADELPPDDDDEIDGDEADLMKALDDNVHAIKS